MSENILEITDDSFEAEVLKADIPVLVDFWAPWCGPCRAIAPIMETLADIYDGKIKFAKCNVDNNPVTPSKFNISSIPTMIFFQNGEVYKDAIVGLVPRETLEATIVELTGNA